MEFIGNIVGIELMVPARALVLDTALVPDGGNQALLVLVELCEAVLPSPPFDSAALSRRAHLRSSRASRLFALASLVLRDRFLDPPLS